LAEQMHRNEIHWREGTDRLPGFGAGDPVHFGCNAVESNPIPGMTAMTGYLYDADGARVAKSTITTMSCDPTANGFQFTENYVLGPTSEELTMLDGNNNWQRTNVYAAGELMATYDISGLHFHLSDPVGSRRIQLSGNLTTLGEPEAYIQSLPFGDQLASSPVQYAPGTADDATPLYFTGKERDAESGNDYFGARYYASSLGRWLSPDRPFTDQHNTNPQSWNLYSYVRNNPLLMIDPDGTIAEIAVNGNNVTITIPVYFTGPNVDARAVQAYTQQMQAAWTGQFGHYNVTTIVRQESSALGFDTTTVKIAPIKPGPHNAPPRDNVNATGGTLMNLVPLPAEDAPFSILPVVFRP